jgi:hypothetical protein
MKARSHVSSVLNHPKYFAGYNTYFIQLGEAVQEEIIGSTKYAWIT